jgi:hypothetical protein
MLCLPAPFDPLHHCTLKHLLLLLKVVPFIVLLVHVVLADKIPHINPETTKQLVFAKVMIPHLNPQVPHPFKIDVNKILVQLGLLSLSWDGLGLLINNDKPGFWASPYWVQGIEYWLCFRKGTRNHGP